MLSARQSEFFCRKKEGKRANDEFGSIKPPPLAQPPPPPPQKKPFSLGQASDVIPKLLGARARVLTTRCVLNELKMMGPEFRAAAIDARKGAALHYCGHGGSDGDVGDVRRRQQQQESGEAAPAVSKNEPCLPAAACLASCVGPAGNAEHFIVATQDRALRAALGEAPAGANSAATGSRPGAVRVELTTREAYRRLSTGYDAIERVEIPSVAQERRIGFSEVEIGYGSEDARLEALRCLRCFDNIMLDPDLCILCGLCVDVCPTDCITIARADLAGVGTVEQSVLLLDEDQCIRCGLCINRCPPSALSMVHAKEVAR